VGTTECGLVAEKKLREKHVTRRAFTLVVSLDNADPLWTE